MQKIIDEARRLQGQLSEALEQLSRIATELNEDNNRLTMLNHQMTEQLESQQVQLDDMNEIVQESAAPQLYQSGRDRLQTFYDNGIHVCHELFGKRRESDEQCLFCQDVIDRLKVIFDVLLRA